MAFASGSQDKFTVPLFDGKNYTNWKFRMETLLEELELKDVIEEKFELKLSLSDTPEEVARKEKQMELWKKRDNRCKSQIIQRIADSHLEYVKDFNTALDMWKSLQGRFQRKSLTSNILIRKKLLQLKYKSEDSMEEHFLTFDSLIRELKETGVTLEDNDIICHLLITMPSDYDALVTALENLAESSLTLGFVKTRLREEEAKRKDLRKDKVKDTNSSAFMAKNKFTFKCLFE